MSKPAFSLKDLVPSKIEKKVKLFSWSATGLISVESKIISANEFLSSLQGAVNRASVRIAVDLKGALDDALRSDVWNTASGTSDIYDTGELLASGKVLVSENGISITYDAPYAALVHYGGYINAYGNQSAKVYLPPRPWIESVLNGGGAVSQFDFTSYYREEIEAEFNG